ncbi:hypothetical protein XI01_14060 [Bradyrhizobium sp. CCBAU 21360]|nr:hypothetical protein [Bradyrhizobium sp. CCBAU 21360]
MFVERYAGRIRHVAVTRRAEELRRPLDEEPAEELQEWRDGSLHLVGFRASRIAFRAVLSRRASASAGSSG